MNTDDLRSAIQALPPIRDTSFWGQKRSELRERIMTDDPAMFLTWPTVVSTMYVGSTPELERRISKLPELWRRAIADSNMGYQACHIYDWQEATGRDVLKIDSIIEFGAGYGALPAFLRRLGYRGTYAIIDVPEFVLLQRYYLARRGITDVQWIERPRAADLFVSLWALNETDAATQQDTNAAIVSPDVLLAYADAAPPSILSDPRWQWTTRPAQISHTTYAYGVVKPEKPTETLKPLPGKPGRPRKVAK